MLMKARPKRKGKVRLEVLFSYLLYTFSEHCTVLIDLVPQTLG